MKDGIYRVTLKVDGQSVVAEAQVRNGVFQGLGALSGVLGIFAPTEPLATTPSHGAAFDAVPDHGMAGDAAWARSDVACVATGRSASEPGLATRTAAGRSRTRE